MLHGHWDKVGFPCLVTCLHVVEDTGIPVRITNQETKRTCWSGDAATSMPTWPHEYASVPGDVLCLCRNRRQWFESLLPKEDSRREEEEIARSIGIHIGHLIEGLKGI